MSRGHVIVSVTQSTRLQFYDTARDQSISCLGLSTCLDFGFLEFQPFPFFREIFDLRCRVHIFSF